METIEKPQAKPEEPKSPEKSFYIVGIGASAGGLEAIESFVMNMPEDSNIAIFIIQHLSPDYKSMMVELLSKKTKIPVFRVDEGMEIKPGCIYLNSPKKNITIFHGKAILTDQDPGKGINLPIDIFLRSLAENQGERAIGVILSGTGSDGTRGIRSIKENGGMVMVQDLEPEQLISYIKHPYASKGTDAGKKN